MAKDTEDKEKRNKEDTRVISSEGKAAIAGPPLTLDEARKVAGIRILQSNIPTAALDATNTRKLAEPTPAKLGEERVRLEIRRQKEQERRKREYVATMSLMKARGAKGIAAKAAAAKTFTPLQVVAEGDSWFDYPVPFFGGGIIKRLEDRLGVPILNLAEAGDEVRFMLGVKQRRRLIETLKHGCPAGGSWDVLLFSGGGNDIVDNPMALWLCDWVAGALPENQINSPRYNAALQLIRAGYEDLISLRDSLSSTTHLIFHAYDFAIPDGRGVCHLGPWMKPAFDLHGYPDLNSRFIVVKEMLKQFASMLSNLQAMYPSSVTFINGQGTLPIMNVDAWHNELHPKSDGFDKFADLFQRELKRLFPRKVA
ncbi:MAG: hypothetical protein ACOYMG_09615 [Candidatus Methylumidiphilus sp.]